LKKTEIQTVILGGDAVPNRSQRILYSGPALQCLAATIARRKYGKRPGTEICCKPCDGIVAGLCRRGTDQYCAPRPGLLLVWDEDFDGYDEPDDDYDH
jgi:hypothetical protein